MHIFAFILIAGIWAAFLLPSLLDGRRQAPMSSTRNFARSKNLLASVSASDSQHVLQRRRSGMRRRRILAGIAAGAVVSLAIAVMQSSTAWLAITIGFDIALAGYVTLLLVAQQGTPVRASVVELPRAAEPVYESDNASVRIVAG